MHQSRAARTAVGESLPFGRFHFDFAALVDMSGADQQYSTRSAGARKAYEFMSAVKICVSIVQSE